jgi:hypothetical protein
VQAGANVCEEEVKKTLVAPPETRRSGQKSPQRGGAQELPSEALRKIRGIYGLSEPLEASNPAPAPPQAQR